jgi:hypothetical protein
MDLSQFQRFLLVVFPPNDAERKESVVIIPTSFWPLNDFFRRGQVPGFCVCVVN